MLSRGTITLVFDDGYQAIYDQVLPALNARQLPGVFALTIQHEGLAKQLNRIIKPWEEWRAATQQGHELASHTLTHPNLTTLSNTQLDQELKESQALLQATTLVYPGGAVNDQVTAVARQYYTAARGVQRGLETIPPADPYRLRTFNFTRRNFSLWKANAIALWACLTNTWLIETYHMVSDTDSELTHSVPLATFVQHLNFLTHLPVKVQTIKDVVKPPL